MKKTLFLVMAMFGIFLLNNASQTYGLEMSAEQKMRWEATQEWWELWKNGDKERCKAVIHKDYTFWSSTKMLPESKDANIDRLFSLNMTSYKLEPVKITISGNLALIMYSWTFTCRWGQFSGRSTSFLMKQDGKWYSMGGMNASCKSPARCPPNQ